MSDEAEECKCPPKGAPMWLATFADLMSLLMCFFVLLLSFSEMDVLKYKQVAGSMESAFGVQRLIEDSMIPKGTSIIAQEFSPGKPEPTVIKKIQQVTSEENKEKLEDKRGADPEAIQKIIDEKVSRDAEQIAEMMAEEIRDGKVDVEINEGKVVIRIRERGSFGSGSAILNPGFYPVIEKIRMVLAEVEGNIEVSGHTDNIPISTERYRSNWELSASRAVSVTHAILETGEVEPMRFSVNGYADTKPLVPNDTKEGRILNRRVEVIVQKPTEKLLEDAQKFIDNERKEEEIRKKLKALLPKSAPTEEKSANNGEQKE